MKKLFPLLVICAISLAGCKQMDEPVTDAPESNQTDTAIEIHKDAFCSSLVEFIEDAKHAPFMTPPVRMMISKSSVAPQRMAANRVITGPGHYTAIAGGGIPSFTIPIFRREVSKVVILENGNVETTIKYSIDTTVNLAYRMNATPFDMSIIATRLELKNGIFRSYNQNGKLLTEVNTKTPNMKSLIESVKNALSQQTKTPVKRDKEWFITRVKSSIEQSNSQNFSHTEDGDGNIVIEVDGSQMASPMTRSIVQTKVRSTYAKDDFRLLSSEISDGAQLLSRTLYGYCKDNIKLSSNVDLSSTGNMFNYQQMRNEQLVVVDDIPMISTNTEYCFQNQVIYHSQKL